MRRIPLVLCVVPACLMLAHCGRQRPDEDEGGRSPESAVVSVRTAPVVRGDMAELVTATGATDAVRREKILSPIAGSVISLRVLEGSAVKRGEVVAVIQPREARAAITGAEALMRAAVTPDERAEAARAMKLAQGSQNDLELRSSTDGVVSTRSVTEGELVAENSELMSVVDLATLAFYADVALQDVPRVRAGLPASVTFQALPGLRFGAIVDAVNPRSDPASQTVKVRLRFTGPERERSRYLRADMNGIAAVVTGMRERVLIVPKQAVLRNDETGACTVVLATPDSLARVIPVDVGARTDSTAEVSGPGLAPGARVVVEGNYALADSTRIAPLP